MSKIEQLPLELYNSRSETLLFHCREPKPGLFIAESAKVIERALAAGYRPESVLMEDTFVPSPESDYPLLLQLLRDNDSDNPDNDNIPIHRSSHEEMMKIAGYHLTGGILSIMGRKRLPSAESILNGKSRVAVLEGVNNPTNVGAIVRSAAAMGMDAVLFTGGCSDPLYRRAIRVSMGCIFQIPWTVVSSADLLFETLKGQGFTTAALALTCESVSIDDPGLKASQKLALYLGNEGSGLPRERIEKCDYTAKIPMREGVDSLNVAAASAVAFWVVQK
ncbi:MAG: RNA methyltransferase [Lachnospiraceae bacterium]|nr:RNA methyltransferase [Lachnospiraceae bacterium]